MRVIKKRLKVSLYITVMRSWFNLFSEWNSGPSRIFHKKGTENITTVRLLTLFKLELLTKAVVKLPINSKTHLTLISSLTTCF
jgi:hypothetical protein